MSKFRWAAALLLVTCAVGGLAAEPLTLDAAVARALAVNVGYQNTLLAVDRAEASLTSLVNWKGISVSATQKQTSPSTGPNAAKTSTTNVSLNLPLLDQLGASASVDQDGNAQVQLSSNPLSHSDTAVQSSLSYQKAVLSAQQARTTLEVAVRKAWLAQTTAQAQYEIQQRKTAALQTSYDDAKARYDTGAVTLAEVRTALQNLTSGRSALTNAERTLVRAKADLAGQLQTETVELSPLDETALEAIVAALPAVDRSITGNGTAVKLQGLDVQSSVAKANAVWLLDPSLSVNAGASIPAQGQVSWSASVTLSLSLGSWQGSDKSLAERSVSLANQTLTAQVASAKASESQALLALDAATATVDARKLALGQAEDLLEETQILFQAGQATDLDLEDAQIGVTSARMDLFSAWADVYGARLDLTAARS